MRQWILSGIAIALFAAPAMADVLRVPRQFGSIQAAVDAAGNGDVIVIRQGAYAESVLINNKTNLQIRGSGRVLIQPGIAALYALGAADCPGLRVQNLTIRNPGFNALVVENSSDVLITKCRLEGDIGLVLSNCDGAVVVGCKAKAMSAGFAAFTGATTLRFAKCAATLSVGNSVGFTATCDTIRVIRCKVTNSAAPSATTSTIELKANTRIVAERCKVITAPTSNPNAAAIFASGVGTNPVVRLFKNKSVGHAYGIVLFSDNSECAGNRLITTEAQALAYIVGDDNLVERNKLTNGDPLARGFWVAGNRNRIVKNKATGGGTGVFLGGNDNTVANNKFKLMQFGVSLVGSTNTIGPRNKFRGITGLDVDDGGVGTVILP